MFDAAVIVPVYNHGPGALRMVGAVLAQALHCIVVDDGSEAGCAAMLDALQGEPGVTLLRLPRNRGKGAAVMAGMRAAAAQGRSHVLQIDADGQHDAAAIAGFLQAARQRPGAVICGVPIYDLSAPLGRRIGRWLTHVWVWVHTLSLAIRDSMCGLRVYPLALTIEVIDSQPVGERMDFDTEILVYLAWRGVEIVNRPTRVIYPAGGVSHFRMWHDNVCITRMHVRLFFGMLRRAPALLARRIRAST